MSVALLCSVLVSETTLCAEAVVCVTMRNDRMIFVSEAVEEAAVFAVLHYANAVWRDGRLLKAPRNSSFRTGISTQYTATTGSHV
jgi:hypothetical protein